jgi:iron-sulfur cluster assembly accessory protein
MESMTDTAMDSSVILTDAAAAKVSQLLAEQSQDLALRVAAQPSGCSGMRYQLFFDDQSQPGDVMARFGDIRVVMDAVSAPFLGGATIDFADTAVKQGFTIDNPNDRSSCACQQSTC